MKKIYSYIALLIILSLILSSCGANTKKEPEGPVTLTFATFMEEGAQADAYKEIIEAFEANHNNIKVTLQAGAVGYDDKISNSIQKGTGPDIIGLQRNRMLQYVKQGSLMDMSDWVNSNSLRDKYYGVNTGYGKYNGKYYGIGDLPYTIEWFYNEDMFKKAGVKEPQDVDQLIDICNKLRKYTSTPLVFGAKDNWPMDTFFGMITVQTIDSEELSAAFTSGEKEKYAKLKGADTALGIVGKLIKAGTIYDDINDYTYAQSIDAFVKGKAAILPVGSWAIDRIEKLKPKGFNYKTFDNPVKFVSNPYSAYSATAVQVITVNNKTGHSKEVKEFMTFLFSEDAQKIFRDKNGISGLKSVNTQNSDSLKNQIVDHLGKTDENSNMYMDNISGKMMEVTANRLMKLIEGDRKASETWQLITDESFAK